MCEMINDLERPKSGKHGELEASQRKKSECAVKKIKEAMSHFINLSRIGGKEKLYCLAFGLLFQKK